MYIFGLPIGRLVNPPLLVLVGGVGRVYVYLWFAYRSVGEPALTGFGWWGWLVGWGGFMYIFGLPIGRLVNPPLLVLVGGGWLVGVGWWGLVGGGWLVGWGGFIYIFGLPIGRLVNPPLLVACWWGWGGFIYIFGLPIGWYLPEVFCDRIPAPRWFNYRK